MKQLLTIILSAVAALLTACASVPPEAVTAQEKISAGIEAARKNQIMLIDRFADEAKISLRLKYKDAIPAVLQKKLAGRASFTPTEVQSLLSEYGTDLEGDLKKVDDQRARLVRETDRFFNDLGSLSSLNQQVLASTVQLNKTYKAAFDQLKTQAEPKFAEILSN